MNKIESSASLCSFCSSFLLEETIKLFVKSFLRCEVNIETQLTSFSNINFKVRDSFGNVWVLRISNEVSYRLCAQKQEKAVLEWAFEQGFSLLEVCGYDEQEGYLLTRFLAGEACSAIDFQNPLKLREALDILYRLHTSKTAPITVEFDPLKRYVATCEKAAQEGVFFIPEIHAIARLLKFSLSHIPANCFQKAPCHNDPSPANFFLQNGLLYLHDWELAGCNDPMWDLAHFSVISQIEPEKILQIYPTTDPLAREKIVLFRAFVLFNTIVWAALEREKPSSSLPKETVEMLYRSFLQEINQLINSTLFKTTLKKLCRNQSNEPYPSLSDFIKSVPRLSL